VLSENLWRIRADIGQLEQIITNLAINARDAMPHGGRLTIETRNIVLGDEDAGSEKGLQPGPHVVLAVSDTGNGMDPETLGRVFEPFFTTKGLGRGTGLGLATVYGIVKQSGGGIWVYSEPGKGSVFKIALPHTDAPLDALDAPTPGLVPGTETILLVEDEQDVRGLARQALEEAGYTVLDAADGLLALDIAARHTGEIHLLVTDVVMPRMHGRAVAERLTALRPGLKVLYMSGYTANVIVHHGILDTGIEFLEKPFTPSALTIKVRATLDL
jgi:CheY-like chemotaxis protein